MVSPSIILIGTAVLSLISTGCIILQIGQAQFWLSVLLSSLTILMLAIIILIYCLKNNLLKPLVMLETVVAKVCEGEQDTHLPLKDIGILHDMVKDIDSISEELTDVYEDMDIRIYRQTTLLQRNTTSLKILYDVAVSINRGDNINQLLVRFLGVIKQMMHGVSATARMIEPNGQMRVIASIGLDEQKIIFPAQLCTCGIVLTAGDIVCNRNAKECSKINQRQMFDSGDIELFVIPFEHQNEMFGTYSIYVKKKRFPPDKSVLETLSTIGNHLGMAIAKKRLDAESHRLSIIKERTAFAHELHDSLAQTLAGLRFQVRMLDDSIRDKKSTKIISQDIDKLRNGLDEAHTELRELLSSFRAPIDQRGLIFSLEKLIQRFSNETGVNAFFQCECQNPEFSPSTEMQVLRIVQESLTNIQKHAHAHTVRVLLSCPKNKRHRLLIEDDGVGFDGAIQAGKPGEHIGLSIMQERAKRLGGELKIESERGEGLRIEIIFDPSNTQHYELI